MGENGERQGPVFAPNYVTLRQLKEKYLREKEEEERKLKEQEDERQKQIEIEKQKQIEIEKQKPVEIRKQQVQNQNRSNLPQGYVTSLHLKEKHFREKEQEERRQKQKQNQGGGKMVEKNGEGEKVTVDKGKKKQSVADDEMQGKSWYQGERRISNNRSNDRIPVGKGFSDGRVGSESGFGVKSGRFRGNGDDRGGENGSMVFRDQMDGGVKGGERRGNRWRGKWRNGRNGDNRGDYCVARGDYYVAGGNGGEKSLEKIGESGVVGERKMEGESSEIGKRNGGDNEGRSYGFRSNLNRGENVGRNFGGVRRERNVVSYNGGKSEILEVKDGVVDEGLNDSMVAVEGKAEGESSKTGKRNGGENRGRSDTSKRNLNRGENVGRNVEGVRMERKVVWYDGSKSSKGNEGEQSLGKMPESEIFEDGAEEDDGVVVTVRIPIGEWGDHYEEKSLEVDSVKDGEDWERRDGFGRNSYRGGNVPRKFGGVRSDNRTSWRERNVVCYRSSVGSESKGEVHEEEGYSQKVEESEDFEVGVNLDCLAVTDIVQEAELNVKNMAVEDKNKAESSEGHMAEAGEVRNGRRNFGRNWNKRGNVGRNFGRSGFGGGRSGNVRSGSEANGAGSMNSASSGSKAKVHEFEANEGERNSEEMRGGEALVVGVKLDGSKVTDNVQEEGLNENDMVVENKNNAESSKAQMVNDGIEGEGRNEFRRNRNKGGNVYGGSRSGYGRVRTVANICGSVNVESCGSESVHEFKANAEGENSEKVTENEIPEVGAKLDNVEVMDNVQEADLNKNDMVGENKNKAGSSEVDRAKDGNKREYGFRRNNRNSGRNVGRNFGRPAFGGPRSAFDYRDSGPRRMKQRNSREVWVKREEIPGGANDAEAGSSGTY